MSKIFYGITKVGMIAASILSVYAVGMIISCYIDDIKWKKEQKKIKLERKSHE